MPSSLSFVGSGFGFLTVIQVSPVSARVTFTQDPRVLSAAGVNDALNPNNYIIVGPNQNSISSINPVSGNPQQVVITFNDILGAGTWSLSIQNIVTSTGNPLAPTSQTYNFLAEPIINQPDLDQGAVQQSAEEVLRKWFPAKYKGKKNWDALIAAMATGDQYIQDLASTIHDQVFIETAVGGYLDQRASDEGMSRPKRIGVQDDIFRDLVIGLKNEKITLQAFLKILGAFYSPEQTRAYVESKLAQPFNISAGDQLWLNVDGKRMTVIFEQNDFAIPNAASAIELANVFNRYFTKNNLDAFSSEFKNPLTGLFTVKIFSGAIGLKGSVSILGGNSQNSIQFPLVLATTQDATTQWQIVKQLTPNRIRYTFVGGTNPTLSLVNVGDYVNIYGMNFHPNNRGSFTIAAVGLDYFEIVSMNNLNETVTQGSVNGLLFFSPKVFKVTDRKNIALAVQGGETTDITLPVTTQIIKRDYNTATYFLEDSKDLANPKRLNLISKEYTPTNYATAVSGIVTLTLGTHAFNVGERVMFSPAFVIDNNTGAVIYEGSYTITAVAATTISFQTTATTVLSGAIPASLGARVTGNFRDSDTMYLSFSAVPTSLVAGSQVITENLTVQNYVSPGTIAQREALFTRTYTKTYDAGITNRPSVVNLDENNIFVTGGLVGAAAVNDAWIYSKQTRTFTNVTNLPTTKNDHQMIALSNKSVIIFGGTGGTTGVHLYNRDLNNYTPMLSLTNGRSGFGAAQVSPTQFFLFGGGAGIAPTLYDIVNGNTDFLVSLTNQNPLNPTIQANRDGQVICVGGTIAGSPIDECFLYDNRQKVFKSAKSYPEKIEGAGSLFWEGIGAGVSIFCGGRNNLSGVSVSTGCYYYDLQTDDWIALPAMPAPIYRPRLYSISKEEFAVYSGSTLASSPFTGQTNTYIYNKSANAWRTEKTSARATTYPVIAAHLGNDDIVVAGNTIYNDSPSFVQPAGIAVKYAGLLNQVGTVLSRSTQQLAITNPAFAETSSITAISPSFTTNEGTLATGQLLRMASLPSTKIGYYWTDRQFEITKLNTTSTQAIQPNSTITQLNVTNVGADWPETGFIVIGYGQEYETGPVKYIQKNGTTILSIDPDFVFLKTIPTGASVIYVPSRDNFNYLDFPALFLTDSVTPRIFAEDLIDRVAAVGANITKTILYPSTIGLGNSQIGPNVSGKPKLNDAVYIWGSQDYLDKKRGE